MDIQFQKDSEKDIEWRIMLDEYGSVIEIHWIDCMNIAITIVVIQIERGMKVGMEYWILDHRLRSLDVQLVYEWSH